MNAQIGKLPSVKDYMHVMYMWHGDSKSTETQLPDKSLFGNPVLLNVLNQSPCVTWILDLGTKEFNFITSNTVDFFGYDSVCYEKNGQSFHEQTIHADDLQNTRKLMHTIWNLLDAIPSYCRPNYKFSHDYRLVKPDGKIVRILEQNAVWQQDAAGNITHLLGVCNDITQWKKSGSQLASLTSVKDKQYLLFNADNTAAIKPKTILSKRELEIVKLMAEGYSSKHIADKLFISFHTVNTHRQKMIEKTGTRNTGGLVQFASFNGLI
jgi:DNA-binding CsgD family transcriptional regulator